MSPRSFLATAASPPRATPGGITAGQPLPLEDARVAFVASLLARSPRTARNCGTALGRFWAFLLARGHDPARVTTDQLGPTILEDFYTWLLQTDGRQRRRSAVTYTNETGMFLRFCDRHALLAPGVTYARISDVASLAIGKVPYHSPKIDPVIARVVTTAQAAPLPPAGDPYWRAKRLEILRDRALLTTLLATGARRSEVVSLSRADVEDGRLRQALVRGKGEKERVLFFDPDSRVAIRAYLVERADPYVPLFLRHDDGRGHPGAHGEHWRLSSQSVGIVVNTYADLAGVATYPHQFRHLKARVLLNNGAQLSEVQDILGHASPETTKKFYAQYSQAHLRASFDTHSRSAAEILADATRPERSPQ